MSLHGLISLINTRGSLDLRLFHACMHQLHKVEQALLEWCLGRQRDCQDLESTSLPMQLGWMGCQERVLWRRMRLALCGLSACSSHSGRSANRLNILVNSTVKNRRKERLTKEVSLTVPAATGSQAFCSSNVGSAHGCKSPDANIP